MSTHTVPDTTFSSPNCDERPEGERISLLVIHNIALPPGEYGGPWIDDLFMGRLDPKAHPYFEDIAALTVAYDLLAGSLFVPVIGAILWRRGTGRAALASISASSVAVVLLLILKGMNSDAPIYVGLGLSLVIYVSMSLLERPRSL